MSGYSSRKELARLTRTELLEALRTRTIVQVRNLHLTAESAASYLCLDLNRRFRADSMADLSEQLVAALELLDRDAILTMAPDEDWDYILEDGVERVERLILPFRPQGGGGNFITATIHRKV